MARCHWFFCPSSSPSGWLPPGSQLPQSSFFAHTAACGTMCELMRKVMKFNCFPKEVEKAWICSRWFTERSRCHHTGQLEAQRQEQLKPVSSPWEIYRETMTSPGHASPETSPGAAVTWSIASAGEPSQEGPLAIARSVGVSPSGATSRRRGSLWTQLLFSNQVQSSASSCVSTTLAKQYEAQGSSPSLLSAQRIAQEVLACPGLGACPYCTRACSSRG